VVSIGGIEAGSERVRELVDWAVEHCPVTDTIARAVPLDVELR